MIKESVGHLLWPRLRKVSRAAWEPPRTLIPAVTTARSRPKAHILKLYPEWSHFLKISPKIEFVPSGMRAPSLPLSLSYWILQLWRHALYTLHWVTSTHITSAEWNICKPEQQPTPSSESAEPLSLYQNWHVTEWKAVQRRSSRERQCSRASVHYNLRAGREAMRRQETDPGNLLLSRIYQKSFC